jgi:protein PhnA
MSIDKDLERALAKRCGKKCEICATPATDKLSLIGMLLPPAPTETLANSIMVCPTCLAQIEDVETVDGNHLRCLNDAMWSPELPVQVQTFRLFDALIKKGESWAQDLKDMMYFDDSTMEWAVSGIPEVDDTTPTIDSNGVQLFAGDNVTVIKDLQVKGSSLVAKRGTVVRGISLMDNPEHVEGRVEKQKIVLLSCYLKKNG